MDNVFKCSFCDKPVADVAHLIQGSPTSFICDVCIDAAGAIVEKNKAKALLRAETPGISSKLDKVIDLLAEILAEARKPAAQEGAA